MNKKMLSLQDYACTPFYLLFNSLREFPYFLENYNVDSLFSCSAAWQEVEFEYKMTETNLARILPVLSPPFIRMHENKSPKLSLAFYFAVGMLEIQCG